MCPAGRPLHLLLLLHALADYLVHRRFNGGRAEFAVSVAFAEVRDKVLIVADVGLEFTLDCRSSSARLLALAEE